MNLTVVTCTNNRPEAFALCEKYLARQTVKPFQVIVLDDGTSPAKCTLGQEYYYLPHLRGKGSMVGKLKAMMETNLVKGDAIVFWEDDDIYASDWLAWCADKLAGTQLVGEGRTVYYNVKRRWWFQHINMQHASLCSTAIRRELFPLMVQLLSDPCPFLDDRLWKAAGSRGKVFEPGPKPRVVGIKEMPGLSGYSAAHRERDKSAKDDPDGKKLRDLLGADADAYFPYYDKSAPLPIMTTAPATPSPFMSETDRVHGPNWKVWLKHLIGKEGARGLEIGTFKGESAECFLTRILTGKDATLMCVDPFTGAEDHKAHGIDCTQTERLARERLARFGERAIIHRALSQDQLKVDMDPFDFCYIDGSHTAPDVLRDAILCYDLLKPGGIMIFDDVQWTAMEGEVNRPKIAVDAFLSIFRGKVGIVSHGGWQTCLRKV